MTFLTFIILVQKCARDAGELNIRQTKAKLFLTLSDHTNTSCSK